MREATMQKLTLKVAAIRQTLVEQFAAPASIADDVKAEVSHTR